MANGIEHSVTYSNHIQDFTEWNPNPIFEVSLDGKVLYSNLAARALFPNLQYKGAAHPILENLSGKIDNLVKVPGELTVLFREIKYLGSIYEQQIFSVGDKTSICVYMDDVTARKMAEEQLKTKNTELTGTTIFLNNILESSKEYSIIATDLNGNILTWNAGARQNYGYEKKEMLGKHLSVLHSPEDIQSGVVQKLFDNALAKGNIEGEFERVRKNGEHFIASVVLTVRLDADNQAMGYLLISKDITEHKHLEEQLRINRELEEQNKLMQEASRLKAEFLSNMSHELRTPLNAIIGFSELIYEEDLGAVNEAQKDALNDVLTSAKNLLDMIRNLLEITNISYTEIRFHPEEIDIRKLISEFNEQFAGLAQKKNVTQSTVIDDGIKSVYLDPMRLKQVLYNYLSNAFKFIPANGSVCIRIMPEKEETFRIEVEDSGGGIKPDDMKKLFVTLQQLDSSSTKKYAGTGLGLSLTKHIVEAQGGEVGAICLPEKNIFYAILPRKYPSSD